MRKLLLLALFALLIVGCGKKKTQGDLSGEMGEGFDLGAVDSSALGGGQDLTGPYAGDLPLGATGAQFVEPNSPLLDPAIAAEAQMVLRDIHFPYNSSQIMPADAAILQQIGAFMKRFPTVVIQIGGHCDERGTDEYNMALGSRRANAARQFLADLGVDPNRIFTISYGEEQPVDPGNNETAWAKNRRDHFLIGVAGASRQ